MTTSNTSIATDTVSIKVAPERRAAERASRLRHSRWYQRLSFKQALLTFTAAIVLSLLSSGIQLYSEWRHSLREANTQAQLIPDIVRRSVTVAMDPKSEAIRPLILDGIFANPLVERVTLIDTNNQIVTNEFRPRVPANELSEKLGTWLFARIEQCTADLSTYNFETGKMQQVGRMEVLLSPTVIADKFYERVSREWKWTLLREFLVALVIVILMYWLITKPLLSISQAMSKIDPRKPGTSWVAPPLMWHKRDELGQLTGIMNGLTDSLQVSLDEQSRGQRQLYELNQDLEQRVIDRTKDLESALAEVAQGKQAAEQSLAELDFANVELSKAITLVMDSINYAKRIQMALLPGERQIKQCARELAVWWEPLHVVGGDFYMVQKVGAKSLLVLADCTGHGVPGAFITLVVANALDQLLRTQQALQMEDMISPDELLALLDEQVRQRLHQDVASEARSDDGLDCAMCLWDPDTNTLTYAGAGIPLLKVSDGEWHYFKPERNGIGYASDAEFRIFECHTIEIKPHDTFYMFSDGVTDHIGGDPPRLLGRRRLAQFLAANSNLALSDITEAVQQELDNYRGENDRRDDCAFMAFRLGNLPAALVPSESKLDQVSA